MLINLTILKFTETTAFVVGLAIFLIVIFGALRLANAVRRLIVWRKVTPTVEKPEKQRFGATVYDLVGNKRYLVVKDFTDYYGGEFRRGEILTFQSMNFLPHHDGYTLNFAERTIYLQGFENAAFLQNTNEYLQPAPKAPNK